ncbi:MAG: TonB family protein [Marinicella sp.]
MKQFLRFSVSGILGFLITATLFVGMLSLLKGKQSVISTQDLDLNFSFVKNYKEPVVKPPKEHIKPKQEKVVQPPTMPEMTLDTVDSPENLLPENASKGKNLNLLAEISMPGAGTHTGPMADNPGTIKAAIAPMYPQQPLINKTEGWVKIKIDVNEFGLVSSATVIDAKPARVFNTAAIKAVKKWKFHPKTIDGKAVPFQATQTIEFKLDQ